MSPRTEGQPPRRGDDDLLTLREVAAWLRVSETTVHGLRTRPHNPLPGFRVGRDWRFRWGDLQAWAAAGGSAAGEEED